MRLLYLMCVYLVCKLFGSDGLFLGVIRMTWYFLSLKLICHLFSQSCNDVKSFCNNTLSAWLLMVRKSRLSSANSFISDDLAISGMSLM